MEHAAPNLKTFKSLLCEYYALRVGDQPSTFMICASFSLMAVDTSFVRASMRACTCNQATWKQTRHTTSDRWQRVAGAGGGGDCRVGAVCRRPRWHACPRADSAADAGVDRASAQRGHGRVSSIPLACTPGCRHS